MKKCLVSIVLLVSVFVSFSQEKGTSIVGEWIFAELSAQNQKGLDEKQLAMMNSMFSEMKLDFKADGKYSFNDGRLEEFGTYEYHDKKKVLSFVPTTKMKYSDKAKAPYETEVVVLEENKLEIKKNKFGLVLKK